MAIISVYSTPGHAKPKVTFRIFKQRANMKMDKALPKGIVDKHMAIIPDDPLPGGEPYISHLVLDQITNDTLWASGGDGVFRLNKIWVYACSQ